MKNLKIFKLRLEYYIRYFGFVFGFAFSALSLDKTNSNAKKERLFFIQQKK